MAEFTIAEAAAVLGVSVDTVRRRIKAGQLTAKRGDRGRYLVTLEGQLTGQGEQGPAQATAQLQADVERLKGELEASQLEAERLRGERDAMQGQLSAMQNAVQALNTAMQLLKDSQAQPRPQLPPGEPEKRRRWWWPW